jgi:FCD domain
VHRLLSLGELTAPAGPFISNASWVQAASVGGAAVPVAVAHAAVAQAAAVSMAGAKAARSRVKLVLHRGIVTGTIPGGTRLVQSCIAEAAILGNLRELSARYITHSVRTVPGRASRADAEHAEILRAIMARDPEAAADVAIQHLDGTPSALSIRLVTELNHLKYTVSD